MALMICPECTGKVSDMAYSCPHCGYPIKKKKEDSERDETLRRIKQHQDRVQAMFDKYDADIEKQKHYKSIYVHPERGRLF